MKIANKITCVLLGLSLILIVLIASILKDFHREHVISAEYKKLCMINGYPKLITISDGRLHWYQSYYKEYFCSKRQNQTDKVVPVKELKTKTN